MYFSVCTAYGKVVSKQFDQGVIVIIRNIKGQGKVLVTLGLKCPAIKQSNIPKNKGKSMESESKLRGLFCSSDVEYFSSL